MVCGQSCPLKSVEPNGEDCALSSWARQKQFSQNLVKIIAELRESQVETGFSKEIG